MVVDPMGQMIAGSNDEECIVRAEVKREIVLKDRAVFPVLRDRVFRT
jgi:predicted amidohydrolase